MRHSALLCVFLCAMGLAASADARTKASTKAPIKDANRFYMEQNGKKMSAKDFDAWMKARGIRVATGKPARPKAK